MAAPALTIAPTFDTSLDPPETTVPLPPGLILHNPKPPREDYALEPPTLREAIFRHSGWRETRARVWSALVRTEASANRLERFASCGAAATVERCTETGEFRIRCHRCRDRWCVPCQRQRAARVAAGLRAFIGRAHRLRLVTLTIQHDQEDRLADLLIRLRRGFRLLRRQPGWKSAIRGGVAMVEITHGACGWHPHLHVLALGNYIPQPTLRELWHRCTGSSVVDVRVVQGETAAGYVTKYLTKPAKPAVMRDPRLLDEAIIALKGTRMVQAFGCVKAADLEPDDDDDPADTTLTWIPLGRLDAILGLPDRDPLKQEFARWISERSPP